MKEGEKGLGRANSTFLGAVFVGRIFFLIFVTAPNINHGTTLLWIHFQRSSIFKTVLFTETGFYYTRHVVNHLILIGTNTMGYNT